MTQVQSKEPKLLIAFFAAIGVIFILLLWVIFTKPEPAPVDNTRSKWLRDSITLLTVQIEDEKKYSARYKIESDSLLTLPPLIKIIYREQKKFTSTATINQLDSIIRSNSGLKSHIKRY